MEGDLVSGLVGAVIGGLFTLWGTLIDGRRQQRSNVIDAKEKKNNVLVGIRAEITSLLEIYQTRMSGAIDTYNGSEPFMQLFPITQNNFPFYESNALALCSVSESTLNSIVRFYGSARSLVDSYKMNNTVIEDLAKVQTLFFETQLDVHKINWQNTYSMATEYGKGLKAIHIEVTSRLEVCLTEIDEEIIIINTPEKISKIKKILKILALIP